MRSSRWFCVLVVGLLLTCGLAAAQDVHPSAKVDKLFARWDRKDSPGCVVMVIKDGKTLHQRAYGMANLDLGTPLSLSSVFLLASVSKQFLVFCLLLLAQGGQLSLDDDIRKHVPEVPDFGKTITLRHMIHHTSGLREDFTLYNLAGWRSGDIITTQDFLRFVKNQKSLNFKPGAQYMYSNTGYNLLALVVERVSKQPFAQFAREKVFTPLGMKHTLVRDDHRMVIPNLAVSYDRAGAKRFRPRVVAHDLPGATNVFSTAGDLALWDQNFYDGKVGGPEVLEAIHRQGKLNDGATIAYAGGLRIAPYRGLKTVAHAGSHGGFRTYFLRFPEQHFSVILLANIGEFNSGGLAHQVADIYLHDQLKPRPKQPAEAKVDPAALKRYVGEYRLGIMVDRVALEKKQLVLSRPLSKKRLLPISDHEFRDDQDNRFTFRDKKEGVVLEKVVGGDKLTLTRFKRVPLLPEQMSAFTGDFYSEELEVFNKISIRDGKLILRYPKGEAVLERLTDDVFVANARGAFSNMGISFSRNDQGQVNGYQIFTDRIRRLQYRRAEIRLKE